MKPFRLFVCAAAVLSASSAFALDPEYVPPELSNLDAVAERPDGWAHTLSLGAAIQVAGSNQVPGQPDGATFTLSLHANYDGELWRGNHELRLNGSVDEAVARTPLIEDFVKASDQVQFRAIYYFHLPSAPWFGPFARASARTSLFQGFDVQPDEVTYLRDGEPIVSDRLQLTDSLAPTYLKQSLGVFARPVEEEAIALDIRLGVGTRETFADGSYVIDDDPDTDEIEVSALQTFVQAGGEAAVELYGASGDMTYGAHYEMLIPFYDSIADDLEPIQATNYDIGAHFGARLSEWASVQYELGLLRIPQVIEEWQVTNSLLLSFNYGRSWGVAAEYARLPPSTETETP